uniref:Nucleoprotein n=3 Tax=Menekre virus TaxID=980880 RepID=F1AM22_9VIRU|nr:nucleoprotein [Menekre virus]
MSNSKEVKSFLWTQALRRELSSYCTNVKVQVVKDAQALLHGLDFSEVSNVQRLMRKDKRDDSDLKRLRDLNQAVNNLVELKSTQQKTVLRIGALTNDDLITLAADLEKLKSKVVRTERPLSAGVYMGNLTAQQLEQRSKLLQLVGMSGGMAPRNAGKDGVVRVWDVKNPELLNNQFGTMPSLTIACMCKQSQTELNDVVQGLSDLGLIYTAKYPNAGDLERLSQTHPVLNIVDSSKSSLNISGYNYSLSAAVKAGACMLDGGNMLETIKVTPKNMESILKAVLKVKRALGMFISDTPGERNPYENLLYKLCLSGDGWPYIASRTAILGRAWENTMVDLNAPQQPPQPEVSNGSPLKAAVAAGYPAGLTFSQMLCLKDMLLQLDPNAKTWIDMEGRPDDPVEIALYQPSNGQYVHFYREPTDAKQFKQDAKYAHGIDLTDLFKVQPGLTSAVMELLPPNMVVTCQGSGDIKALLESQNRRDIKVIDIMLTRADARKFEDEVWDKCKDLCSMHTGIVVEKKKRGTKEEITPHCALLDCIMYEAATVGGVNLPVLRPILPKDLVFRQLHTKVTL